MTDRTPDTPDPDLAELMAGSCYCLAVRRASRRMIRLYDATLEAEAGDAALTISQLGMLACIKGLRQPTVQTIADFMEMDQSATSRGLAPLDRAGLIAARPDAEDKRRRILALTPAGEDALARGAKAWAGAQRRVEAEMGASHDIGGLMAGLADMARREPAG